MRGLTLHRPWPHAIFKGGKNIENRTWKPWKSVLGKFIAIHAGVKYDELGARWMAEMGLYTPPFEENCFKGVIIGVVKIVDYIHESDQLPSTTMTWTGDEMEVMSGDGHPIHPLESPWFFGPYGWLLDEITELPEPVSCKGSQGLWIVPDDVRDKVRDGYLKAKEAT